MIRDEIQILKRLDIPGAMKYYGCLEGKDVIFLVTELVPAVLSRDDKTNIVQQLALAIAALHKEGIAHRDLKPENIMYDTSTGRLTILDYGLSCYAPELIGQCDSPVGTPSYYDPYLPYDGNTFETLAMADWWAFGQIVFVLFTGGLLYDELNRRFKRITMYSREIYMFPRHLAQLVVDLTTPRPQNQRPSEADILAAVTQ